MKYFISSDIHGFFDEFEDALNKAGYDFKNEEHILVICGDIFDRGNQALLVYKYFRSIDNDRLIMIRGNHDYLFKKLYYKDKPDLCDLEDGTLDTFLQLANKDANYPFTKLKEEEIIKECINWMDTKWHYYYEKDKYIFVHSFIPLRIKDGFEINEADYNDLYYDENWRNIIDEKILEKCAFDSSWRKFKNGYFDNEARQGKILICGHTHSYEFFRGLDGKIYKDGNYDFGIYFGKNVINLDGNVEKSGRINVLVIDICD